MAFNSTAFIAFLAVVFAWYRLPISWKAKKRMLLLASYVFYAAWSPPFVLLIVISTIVDWDLARRIFATEREEVRRRLLGVSLAVNLGFLGFFKYGDFLLDNCVTLLGFLGLNYQPVDYGIVLPVAISFYTFQSLSYTIDVYRRTLTPWHSFADFALFVTFFPQLVAGPIVRASDFLYQLVEERRPSLDDIGWGLTLLTLGIAQKVVLADALLAPVADVVFAAPERAGFVDAWAGTLAFANQIYFDFAGYSMCAIGTALLFGFALPDNFRFPYAAIGFSDFWRRWHRSLSTWLRDYLYISLGGNRRGRLKTYRNIVLTMLLGGLWHGANWRFVIWGGLHGTYLVAERLLRRLPLAGALNGHVVGRVGLALLTFFFVCIAWVFFRAETLAPAFVMLGRMIFGGEDNLALGISRTATPLLITVFVLAGQWYLRDSSVEALLSRFPWWLRSIVLALILLLISASSGSDRAFIYFQF